MNEALIPACETGNVEEVKRLLSEGLNNAHEIYMGIRSSVVNGHVEVTNLLRIALVTIHINEGCDINKLLEWANLYRHLEVVEYLNKLLLLEKLNELN
jgi:ankyrin repeat protein